MANIKSAKKRIRVIEAKTQRNRRVKMHLKEVLKAFYAAIEAGEQKTARDTLAIAEQKLMKAASKGVLHKNTASRKVSRITALFVQTFGQDALLEKAEKYEKPAKPVKETKETKSTAKKKAAKETKEDDEEKKAPKKKSTKKESLEETIEPATEEATAEVAEEAAVEAEEVAEQAEEAVTEDAEEKTEE